MTTSGTNPSFWKQLLLGGGLLGVVVAGLFKIAETYINKSLPNQKPAVAVKAFVSNGEVTIKNDSPTRIPYVSGEELTLDGAGSDDKDGKINKYEWLIDEEIVGDRNYLLFKEEFDNQSDNKYRVVFNVYDNKGESSQVSFWVDVSPGVAQKSNFYEWSSVNSESDLSKLNAFRIGDEDGQPRYLCRALYEGEYKIGKTVSGQCNVPYYSGLQVETDKEVLTFDENEIILSDYEILEDSESILFWASYEPFSDNEYPENAVRFISSAAGEESLVCKAKYRGAEHPGIVDQGFCLFSYGGAVGFVPNNGSDSQIFKILVSK
ncbi:hypothetical protein VB780_02220 [Leptolyngbya sp. CCNP1308]|uniref:hypothetical protein n=1 Tax=Leptolyngbya sp. CCNP1308 TaxID=3110255 RepID=UPI002B1F177D|nr:hypothetical protein [Leptolyngbya sp. CCNP1308]MEA5447367.1 hypothetical protein [Leptolyngbya sp. CCNP1308]